MQSSHIENLTWLIRGHHGSRRQYSTQIFSLAVLLCSYFVYNQIGGIDEGSLEKLHLVTEVGLLLGIAVCVATGNLSIARCSARADPCARVLEAWSCVCHVLLRGQVTKHIRVRAGGSRPASARDLAAFTPTFLWLLRDFYLQLEDDGRPVRSSSTGNFVRWVNAAHGDS